MKENIYSLDIIYKKLWLYHIGEKNEDKTNVELSGRGRYPVDMCSILQ